MRRRWPAITAVLLFSAPLRGQAPSIEHQPVSCVVAGKFPRLDARVTPADVGAARVLFQADNTTAWYAVAMKPEGQGFVGVLPKPTKALKAFRYYVEVTDKALATNRTADYTASVVGGASECKGKLVAGALGSAAVLLQAPAGAAALPAGFASTGVVAAGSGGAGAAAGATSAAGGAGLGTGAIVAGVGAVAAGAAVAVAAGGKDSGSGSKNLSGPITGQWTITSNFQNTGGPTTCVYTYALSGTGNMRLEESSATVNGEFSVMMTSNPTASSAANCGTGPGGPPYGRCSFSGSAASFGCTFQDTVSQNGITSNYSMAFSGSLSAGSVTGRVDFGLTGQTAMPTFTAQFSGSTSIPVTLR